MWKTLMVYSVCLWCIGGCSPGVQSKATSSMAEHDEVQPQRNKIEVDDVDVRVRSRRNFMYGSRVGSGSTDNHCPEDHFA